MKIAITRLKTSFALRALRPTPTCRRWPASCSRCRRKTTRGYRRRSTRRARPAARPHSGSGTDRRIAAVDEDAQSAPVSLRPSIRGLDRPDAEGQPLAPAQGRNLQETKLMARSIESKTRDIPWNPAAPDAAALCGAHVAKPILASGHMRPGPTGRTYGRKRSDQKNCLRALRAGAVHIWIPDRSLCERRE